MLTLLFAAAALAQDADLDGTPDAYDLCPGEYDVSLDGNTIADCSETILSEYGMDWSGSASGYAAERLGEQVVWDKDKDLENWVPSGTVRLDGVSSWGSITRVECVPVQSWRTYAVVAQAESPQPYGVDYELQLDEFGDPYCTETLGTVTLDAASFAGGPAIVVLDLFGEYQPPADVRGVRIVVTYALLGWATMWPSLWFDNVAMHPIAAEPTDPTDDPPVTRPPPKSKN